MSRATLIRDCKTLGLSTTVRAQGGHQVAMHPDGLRFSLIESTFGLGMDFSNYKHATELDAVISRAVDTRIGNNGYLLGVAQMSLRNGTTELVEYKRLCGLKRRRPDDEARFLRSAKHWLEISRISQELHSVESALKQRGDNA